MKIRNILLVVGLAGMALVVVLNIHQLKSFFHLLSDLKWYVLLAIVVIQLISYFMNALYYRSILEVFNLPDIKSSRLYKGALAANFVNYLIPSAGVAGAGFFSEVLSPEVPRGQGVLVQIMRYALSALAVLIMMPIGILLVVLTRPESRGVDRAAVLSSMAIVAGAIVIVVFVHNEQLPRRMVKRFEKLTSRLFSRFGNGNFDKFVDDFYVGYRTMIKRRKKMLVPFCWSMIYIVVEMGTLYLAFLAFGKVINPGIVIMGYLLANISSTLGGALFSVGVFELGMLGTFVALGIPFVLALSVTLIYRILNLIIGLPPGFYFYRQILKAKT